MQTVSRRFVQLGVYLVFSDFLNSSRDAEERTAAGKPFQTEVAAAVNAVPPMVARLVWQRD